MKEGFRQAMAWLHTWSGLIFGWLLFAIFLTGTLSYFKEEISHWMQPEVQAYPLDNARSLGVAQTYLQQTAPKAARWFINLPDERDPALSVMWQDKLDPGRRGNFIQKTLDPVTGHDVQARESMGGDFFYRFHFQLQMPHPWGRWLSTIAAMVMFVALITGIITHKKIFKDFFTFRPRKGQRSWLDGHNAVGVLVLPFHLMITYSSLVIFMSMVMPAPILASYGNDTRAFFNDVFPATNNAPALGQPGKLLPLLPMYEHARAQWDGGHVGRLGVNNPSDVNASVNVFRASSDNVVHEFDSIVSFNGTTGELLRQRFSIVRLVATRHGLITWPAPLSVASTCSSTPSRSCLAKEPARAAAVAAYHLGHECTETVVVDDARARESFARHDRDGVNEHVDATLSGAGRLSRAFRLH